MLHELCCTCGLARVEGHKGTVMLRLCFSSWAGSTRIRTSAERPATRSRHTQAMASCVNFTGISSAAVCRWLAFCSPASIATIGCCRRQICSTCSGTRCRTHTYVTCTAVPCWRRRSPLASRQWSCLSPVPLNAFLSAYGGPAGHFTSRPPSRG